MSNTDVLSLTQKELLIRIDERQQHVLARIEAIERNLCRKVEKDEDYLDLEKKVAELWDWKNKVLGMATAAGAISSLVFSFIEKYVFRQ